MVYGYYYKTIKHQPINDVCSNCGASKLQYLDIMSKVNHALYIPIYPSDKILVRKCDVCNTIFDINRTEEVDVLLKQTKYPKYLYSGFILFILFILSIVALFIFGYYEAKEIRNNLINEVHKGYTIIEKDANGYQTSMFITDVRGDSVFVRKNIKSTKGDIYKINEFEYYDIEVKYYSKEQLQKMINEERITDIVPTDLLFEMDNIDLWGDSIQ